MEAIFCTGCLIEMIEGKAYWEIDGTRILPNKENLTPKTDQSRE